MARRPDPETMYRVHDHVDKGYRYAFVQRNVKRNIDGKTVRRKVLLGTLTDDFVFKPNKEYRLMPVEERRKLIFPDHWDISAALNLNTDTGNGLEQTGDASAGGNNPPVSPKAEKSGEREKAERNGTAAGQESDAAGRALDSFIDVEEICRSTKLYGAAWLLEEIAEKYHIRDDLIDVLDGDSSTADEILALAIFFVISNKGFDRMEGWLELNRLAGIPRFRPDYILRLMKTITDEHRKRFIQCRLNELPQNGNAAKQHGESRYLLNIRQRADWDSEDGICSLDAVVYSLISHECVYYRSLPEISSKLSAVHTVISELEQFGIKTKDISFTADNWYPDEETMSCFYDLEIPFLLNVKCSWPPVRSCLMKIRYNEVGLPEDMAFDTGIRRYYTRFDMQDFEDILDKDGGVIRDGTKVDVFLDFGSRFPQIAAVRKAVTDEEECVHDALSKGQDRAPLERSLKYHRMTIEPGRAVLVPDDEAINQAYAQCGYFATCMYLHDYMPVQAYCEYKSRILHEARFYELMQMDSTELQEEERAGWAFVFFVATILMDIVRYAYHTKLNAQFRDVYEVLGRMQNIRYSPYLKGSSHMTAFATDQFSVCHAFGILPPDECVPCALKDYISRKDKVEMNGKS